MSGTNLPRMGKLTGMSKIKPGPTAAMPGASPAAQQAGGRVKAASMVEKVLRSHSSDIYFSPDQKTRIDKSQKLKRSASKVVVGHKKSAESDKPFHGYNPKVHSREGGLSAAGRAKAKKEEGANLKPPVTEKNPEGKRLKRKKSFCARMSGVPGPTSKDGKLTRKGAALKRWRC